MSNLAYRISEIVFSHFLEIWALVLVGAASIAFISPYVQQRAALGSKPEHGVSPSRYSWKLQDRDIVWLAFLLLFLALYICLHFWKQDLAWWDNDSITELLRGKPIRPAIWPEQGRLFPLQLQELNVLIHFTHSGNGFHVFVVLQLLACALIIMLSLSEFTIPLRVLAICLIMCTPSFAVSFSDLIYPERDVLFWLAVFILCRRRYSATASPVFLAGTFIAVQFAVYYKEPAWLLFAGFAGTKLLYDWKRRPRPRGLRDFIRANPADIGTLALAVVFPALFAFFMFGNWNLRHVAQIRQPDLSSTVLNYVKMDLLLSIFLVLVAIRVLKLLRGQSELKLFWDPLAIGGALYALAIIGLRIFTSYFLAPVDAIAILFLLQWAYSWVSEGKVARTLVAGAVCFVTMVQSVAYASGYFIARKNTIAGKVQLAEFLKGYIRRRSGGCVGLFFPYSDGYSLMELSAFLDYWGLPLVNGAPHGQINPASFALESPLPFHQNRCIGYSPYRCVQAEAPHDGDLIVELPGDEVPDHEMARNGCQQLLFSYEPFLAGYLRAVRAIYHDEAVGRVLRSGSWLGVRVYKCGVLGRTDGAVAERESAVEGVGGLSRHQH